MFKFLSLLLFTLFSTQLFAQNINFDAIQFTHQGEKFIAILMDHSGSWHSYWKNPGDSGRASEIHIYGPNDKEVKLKQLEWPYPTRFLQKGNLLSFGHEHHHAIFYYLDQQFLTEYEGVELSIKGEWLACSHICVPEKKIVTASIKNVVVERNGK